MRQRMNVDWTQYQSEELNTEEKLKNLLSKLCEVVEECVQGPTQNEEKDKRGPTNEQKVVIDNKEETTVMDKVKTTKTG